MISQIIRKTRKEKGLKQNELAADMFVSQGYISRVETGKEIPAKMFIKLFCLQYKVAEASLRDQR